MNFVQRSRAINGDYMHSYRKEGQLLAMRQEFALNFKSHPDFQPAEFTTVNGEPRDLIVYQHKTDIEKKSVIAYPGEEIHLGDVIECFGAHWLVTQKDPNTQYYSSGIMELCTTLLKWQNPKTLEIFERWAIVENPYSSNIVEHDVLTTLNGKLKVTVPYDEETSLVHPDKRFIIGSLGSTPMVFKMTFPDIVSLRKDNQGKGLLVWHVVMDEDVHEEDNLELGIADYIPSPAPDPGPIPEETVVYVSISGKDEVIVGYSRKLIASFKDKTGNDIPLDNIFELQWQIENSAEFGDNWEKLITLEIYGNECTVKVANDDFLINKKIHITCTCKNGDIANHYLDCVVM